jgi:hypothetical protein
MPRKTTPDAGPERRGVYLEKDMKKPAEGAGICAKPQNPGALMRSEKSIFKMTAVSSAFTWTVSPHSRCFGGTIQ